MSELSIVSLTERPEAIDACVAWSFGTWDCHKKDSRLQKTVDRYATTATHKNGELPQTWIGFSNDKIVGMISLKADDHPERKDLSPWIASFFIHPEFRGKGHAYIFMKHAEKQAAKLGHKTLYLYTPSAEDLYKKIGWTTFEKRPDPTGIHPHVYVMSKHV